MRAKKQRNKIEKQVTGPAFTLLIDGVARDIYSFVANV